MNTHRWPRATITAGNYGRICECGNLKTDQALSCNDCAVERRRHPEFWERLTCPRCGGPKATKRGRTCRRCRNELQTGVSVASGRSQSPGHRWRKVA